MRFRLLFFTSIALFCSAGLVAADSPRSTFRVVSLAPSVTETLYSVGAGNLIVGVDRLSDYPATAATLPKVGDYNGFSLETIAFLKPTHVVGLQGYTSDDVIQKLKKLRVKYIECKNANLGDVEECARFLGATLGHKAEGDAVAKSLESARAKLLERSRDKGKPTRILVIVASDPYYGVGSKNFLHEVFASAGLENVLVSSPISYPILSIEGIIGAHPEIIFMFRKEDAAELSQIYKGKLSAKAPRIILLDESIFSRSGPRLIMAYEVLERALYGNEK